jgi:hypothetical protein
MLKAAARTELFFEVEIRVPYDRVAQPPLAAGSASILLAVETGGKMPPEPARKMHALRGRGSRFDERLSNSRQ